MYEGYIPRIRCAVLEPEQDILLNHVNTKYSKIEVIITVAFNALEDDLKNQSRNRQKLFRDQYLLSKNEYNFVPQLLL